MVRLSGILFAVALLCALILGIVNQKTAPVIAQQREILVNQALAAVLPADRYTQRDDAGFYYEAIDEKAGVVGWCLELVGKGYGGPIRLLVGIQASGKIAGVKVLEHKETPGLGTKITDVRPGDSTSWFLRQFSDKYPDDIVVVKGATTRNIQAITGATISSQAVVNAVRRGVADFLQKKQLTGAVAGLQS